MAELCIVTGCRKTLQTLGGKKVSGKRHEGCLLREISYALQTETMALFIRQYNAAPVRCLIAAEMRVTH